MRKKLEEKRVKLNKNYFKNFKPDFSDGILRQHNQKVYIKIIKGFQNSTRVLAEQATGTGKTFLMMKILKDHLHGTNSALFVSPTLAIQNYFLKHCKNTLSYTGRKNGKVKLTACQYAGLNKVLDQSFDIIILDEVHRVGAKTWGQKVEELLTNNPNAIVLGMTATLDRGDKVDIRKFFFNKNPVSKLPLTEAIREGILPSPNYTLTRLDYSQDVEFFQKAKEEITKDYENSKGREKAIYREFLAGFDRAFKFIEKNKSINTLLSNKLKEENKSNFKFIVFCPVGMNEVEDQESRLKMEELMALASSWFDYSYFNKTTIYGVHSLYTPEKNKSEIEKFTKDYTQGVKLLFAVNMLNEGLHVDGIDGVIMLRNTLSQTIYLQQLGRALSVGTRTKPYIFDFVANLNYVDITHIINIAKIVNAETDPATQIFKLDTKTLDEIRFIEKLKQKLINWRHRFDYNFKDYYIRLVSFKKKHGNCQVSITTTSPDGYPLGVKTAGIRTGNIHVSAQERQILNDLGFIWAVRDNIVSEYITELVAYKRHFGDCKVPYEYKTPNGYCLGIKTACIRGGTIKVDPHARERLTNLGFVWKINGNLGAEFIREFCEYLNEYHSAQIPVAFVSKNGYPLGKRARNLRSGKLVISSDERQTLNELGFIWNLHDNIINDFVAEFEQFIKENNTIIIPKGYVAKSGYPLGKRANSIRNGSLRLTPADQAVLNRMGFVWDMDRALITEFIAELRDYKRQFKNLKIVRSYVTPRGYPLGKILQKALKNELPLTPADKKLLATLGLYA